MLWQVFSPSFAVVHEIPPSYCENTVEKQSKRLSKCRGEMGAIEAAVMLEKKQKKIIKLKSNN